MIRTCERCSTAPRVRGDRYCKACRKVVRKEMWDSGYLERVDAVPTVTDFERKQNEAKRAAEARQHPGPLLKEDE